MRTDATSLATTSRRAFLIAAAASLGAIRGTTFGQGPSWRDRKRFVSVRGARMAYVDTGAPSPLAGREALTVIFLHGNPTSSYLWRNIIPDLAPSHRCIAPDLVGMGDSDKLGREIPDRYRFCSQREYLDDLLSAIGVGDRVALVLHDWGGMLGFDWARRHASAIRGIAHMETVMDGVSSDTAPPPVVNFFKRYRTPDGRRAVLEENQFVEQVLLAGLSEQLTDFDRAEYRRPFATPAEGRMPTLVWPSEIPVDGEPADVAETFAASRAWLATSVVPKLFVNVEPGALVASAGRKAICRGWPNTTEVAVSGNHFVQEQSPRQVVDALRPWLRTLG